jgi:pyruvate/2-oxoglutarate dehydrogenase complex dihydrolipoamide acyltransferase (E2) component
MTTKDKSYRVIPFPRMRQLIADSGRFSNSKHNIRGLLEIDVTRVRQFIREHKARTGETLSFTAFVIACLGQAVDENKEIHAYRNRRNQLIIFDDVDVLTYIEVELEGQKLPLAHIIRAANRKTWRGIHDEIRAVQADPEQSPKARQWQAVRWFLLLPAFVRQIFYRFVNRTPHLWKKYVGTIYLTAVGMFGTGGGWGIGFSAHTLGIIIGGIGEKPVAIDGRIEIRECLNLTADFDHDLVDGGPAARFIEQLKNLIENSVDFEKKVETK